MINSHALTIYRQIYPMQCAKLATMGYKTLINLRFDDEDVQQPKSAQLAAACQHCALDYYCLPLEFDAIDGVAAQQFADLLHRAQKPVLVFCATGARAKKAYQQAKLFGFLAE